MDQQQTDHEVARLMIQLRADFEQLANAAKHDVDAVKVICQRMRSRVDGVTKLVPECSAEVQQRAKNETADLTELLDRMEDVGGGSAVNEKYIQEMQNAIQHIHGCASRYVETGQVWEVANGETVWRGEVGLFDLIGHSRASQCYAWRSKKLDGHWQYIAVLRSAQIDSAAMAVHAYLRNLSKPSPSPAPPAAGRVAQGHSPTYEDSTEGRIYVALVALLHRGAKGSFVVIEEPRTKKFVQFGKGRCLEMDLPCVALTSVEADRASQFYNELGEEYPREYHAPDPKSGRVHHGATFNHDFGEEARLAAKAAIALFVRVYGFAVDVELSITEY